MLEYIKIPAQADHQVNLKVVHGHFATSHSHTTCYMDLSTLKTRCNEAHGLAALLSARYSLDTPVDTILCIDGTEVIGTYLAEELTKAGILSYNAHKTIYVLAPEYIGDGRQIIFRENQLLAIKGKYVLVLAGAVTTGKTLKSVIECLEYYQANVSGLAAAFSNVEAVEGIPVHAAFRPQDVGEFHEYAPRECPLCKHGMPLKALINGYGYALL